MKINLLFIFSMLFCFSFINGATITSTGTGNWTSTTSWVGGVVPTINDDVIIASGSTITINTNVAAKSLTINGTLLISGDRTVTTTAGNTFSAIINGTLGFSSNQSAIRFPAGTILDVNSPGKIDDSGGCSNNVAIYIGTTKFAVCAGGGNAEYTFDELNNLGGTVQSKPTSNAPICEGSTLTFTAAKDGADGASLSWQWSIKAPGATVFTNYPSKQSIVSFTNALPGSYEAVLTYTTTYSGSAYTNSKTIFATVNSKPAAPTITAGGPVTFCSGGSVTLSSSSGTSYLWSTGATTQSIVVTTSGSYTVKVANATNCQSAASNATTVTVKTLPAVPILGTITQPTCINTKGSVVLSGLIGTSGTVINQLGSFLQTYAVSATGFTISNLAPGTYTFTVQDGASCASLATQSIEIKAATTDDWNGSVWSKGAPPISTDAITFSGDYQSTGNLTGCSCEVYSGKKVTIKSGHTLTIENGLTVNTAIGTELLFENSASLIQINNTLNTGNITYQRTTPPVRRYDLTYWGTPVTAASNFTLKKLSPATLDDKYYSYNNVTDKWVPEYRDRKSVV